MKRTRIQPYLRPELIARLSKYAAAAGTTESAVVQTALEQHLDGTAERPLLLRRLDQHTRALARAQRDLELLTEAFALFVKLWLAHTPPVPPDGRHAARSAAESRYRQFVQFVSEQFSRGGRFLDDLRRDPAGDEAEAADQVPGPSPAASP